MMGGAGLQCVCENSSSENEVGQPVQIQPAERAAEISPARKGWVKWDRTVECLGTAQFSHTHQPCRKEGVSEKALASGGMLTSAAKAVRVLGGVLQG